MIRHHRSHPTSNYDWDTLRILAHICTLRYSHPTHCPSAWQQGLYLVSRDTSPIEYTVTPLAKDALTYTLFLRVFGTVHGGDGAVTADVEIQTGPEAIPRLSHYPSGLNLKFPDANGQAGGQC